MTFLQGEVRKVGIEVISQLNDSFIIDTAEGVILKQTGSSPQDLTEVATTTVIVEHHKLTTLFSHTMEKGTFYVEFKYKIATETLKARVHVEVI